MERNDITRYKSYCGGKKCRMAAGWSGGWKDTARKSGSLVTIKRFYEMLF